MVLMIGLDTNISQNIRVHLYIYTGLLHLYRSVCVCLCLFVRESERERDSRLHISAYGLLCCDCSTFDALMKGQ